MSVRKAVPAANSKARKPGASEIVPGVYVGGWSDSVSFAGTRFCVKDDRPEELRGATHIPIYDPGRGQALPGNLDRLASAMAEARRKGEPILVFCGHGIRRGPLGVAWYLHRSEGISLDDALDRVAAVRPRIERPSEWIEDPENLGSR